MPQFAQEQDYAHTSLTILDGGMGHQLKRMGVTIEGEVGSLGRFLGVALANLKDPDLVVRAHKLYIAAGADVITTNSYACIPACLDLATDTPEGIDLDAIIRAAGECAVKARGFTGNYIWLCSANLKLRKHTSDGNVTETVMAADVQIAGCIPPLTATYRPDLVLPDCELEKQYARICEAIGPYSNLFLCETMSSVREACAAAKACASYHSLNTEPSEVGNGRRIWVAFTLSDAGDGRLRSGETVEEAAEALLGLDGVQIEAVLFNCCTPAAAEVAIRAVRNMRDPRLDASGWRLGGYANAFEAADGEGQYDASLAPARYAEHVARWALAAGSVVGGCCGVFPEHIALLRGSRPRARTAAATAPAQTPRLSPGPMHLAAGGAATEAQRQAQAGCGNGHTVTRAASLSDASHASSHAPEACPSYRCRDQDDDDHGTPVDVAQPGIPRLCPCAH